MMIVMVWIFLIPVTVRLTHSFEGLAKESISKARNLKVPIWKVRLISAVVIAFVLVWIVAVPLSLNLKDSVSSWSEFAEGTDAALHLLVILGGGIFFIASWEMRKKRNAALDALSELRSLAHIIDMHQITKDPGLAHIKDLPEGVVDTRTVRTDAQLALYLDYSSDMLSIIGKLAALYAENLHDRTVLDAVNEIESLSNGLCGKLWQKIMIINQMAEAHGGTE
jgi:hypothetical protein